MSEQPEIYETNAESSKNETATAARAFAMEFRNAFGVQRLVVIASDIWEAMSRGDAHIAENFDSGYPYRLVSVKELDGAVLPSTKDVSEAGQ